MRRGLTAAVLALALAPVASAHAADYTLRAKGSTNGPGEVTAVGGFKPTVDAGTEAAIRVFGQPTSRKKAKTSCQLGWKKIGLRILFANFGGGDSCKLGKSQTVSAFGEKWHTANGLKVGSSVATLRKRYPKAEQTGNTYRLVGAKQVYGNGLRYSVLAAKTDGRKVTSFRLFAGAAGE